MGIIDGVILSDAAVGHREILDVMRSGITVIGGGSMGALRGAELKDFGMIGVGSVYEEYASGRVEGDDEVLLAYDPSTHAPLSVPLINLRLNLRKAVEHGVLDAGKAEGILRDLKRQFYPVRSYDLMLDIARRTLPEEESARFEKFEKTQFEDFKKKDALLVLMAVKKMDQK
ncbi:TfuA-like protein [Methanomassiliicoccus luminyensis]|uniref:TfuA-like protein n=1 Tax=Methanomassiliicoccus luminyensis TaxID=1080712 RepID=UPI00036D92D5|nr:TfuA-like protein [Methanomassiliicoccus luminyensis]